MFELVSDVTAFLTGRHKLWMFIIMELMKIKKIENKISA